MYALTKVGRKTKTKRVKSRTKIKKPRSWRKVTRVTEYMTNKWKNKKRNETLYINHWKMDYNKPFLVSGIKVCSTGLMQTVWKTFKTKPQASKFAKEYMKKRRNK